MKQVIYTKELNWKSHNVDLVAFDAWAKEALGDAYCGNSADAALKLHFTDMPSDDALAAIDLKWEELDDEKNEMCASYKTQAEREAEVLKKKESAKAKLAALGLDADELLALLGG